MHSLRFKCEVIVDNNIKIIFTMIMKLIVSIWYYILLWECITDTTESALICIVVSDNVPCREDLCLSLSQFAQNTSVVQDTNITLLIQQGHHILDTDLQLTDLTELKILSEGAVVNELSARFYLRNITLLFIEGMTFLGYGRNKVENVDTFILENSTFHGKENGTVGNACTVGHQLKDFGSALELVHTNAKLVNCSFISNRFGNYQIFLNISWFYYSNITRCHAAYVGGALIVTMSNITIIQSEFKENRAESGGAIFGQWCNITIIDSTFENNSAHCLSPFNNKGPYNSFGGALYIDNYGSRGQLLIKRSIFDKHYSQVIGGVMAVFVSDVFIRRSNFSNNNADIVAGAIQVIGWEKIVLNLTIEGCKFTSNTINTVKNGGGGALNVKSCNTTLRFCNFSQNSVQTRGGAVFAFVGLMTIYHCIFRNNTAKLNGGTLYMWSINLTIENSQFSQNKVEHSSCSLTHQYHGMFFLLVSNATLDNTTFVNNIGALVSINSNLKFTTLNQFINSSTEECFNGGGAISVIDTYVLITGTYVIKNSYATLSGAALYATNSKIHMKGSVLIANNYANFSGGGIYLYQSELNCEINCNLTVSGNTATQKGGGIHAVSSTISIEATYDQFTLRNYISYMSFIMNHAYKGGGVCLEMNSKLYIQKEENFWNQIGKKFLKFIANSANQGGAIFVVDETYFQTCTNDSESKLRECFFQMLELNVMFQLSPKKQNVLFSQNHAIAGGPNIYGGLLDRCTLSPNSEIQLKNNVSINGLTNLIQISEINKNSISSQPVKVCLCDRGRKNCTLELSPVQVMKGHVFNVSVVAIDQVGHNLNASIQTSLVSSLGGLGENQAIQNIDKVCTNISFSVFSPHQSEKLTLYPIGPCKDALPSQKTIMIAFIPCSCPIGFEPKAEYTRCDCECDSRLLPHITECYYEHKTLVRKGSYWITHMNDSSNDGYLMYPYCPLNYCKPSNLKINISFATSDGVDLQCADHRTGVLCGRCKTGFSLSLGTSRCMQCSNHQIKRLLFIIAITLIAGILLVALVLVLNLTVAVGTMNGIIFYANIMKANRSILFPYSSQNFIAIFLDWLNLEVGFDACFIHGMDTYWKTMLQLFFPLYLVFLVIMIIIFSEYSSKFARLIARRNPVATLATLLLFSYTKLLRTVVTALSFAVLKYPGGNKSVVWLPDASIGYLKGRHIVLFTVGILILVPGVAFTLILFVWQWLLYYQNHFLFRWVRYHKLQLFIEPYHAPYRFSHRYWTGLLLLARIVLYIIVSVVNIPGVIIIVMGTLMTSLLLLKTHSQCYSGNFNGRIHRKKWVDILETICYSNILLFCLARLFVLESYNEKGQIIIAYISGGVMFTLLIIVLSYHLLTEVLRKNVTNCLSKQASREGNETAFDYDHAQENPTCSDLGILPQGEQPMSALIEERLKRRSDSRTVHCEVKEKSSIEDHDELTPLLDYSGNHSD